MFIILFVSLARAFKGLSDTLKSHWGSSVFKNLPEDHWLYKFASGKSWTNKWETDENDVSIPYVKKRIKVWKYRIPIGHWSYGFVYAPKFKEKFLWSSTFSVSKTDLWHTAEKYRSSLYILAIIFAYLNGTEYEIWYTDIPLVFGWAGLVGWFDTVASVLLFLTIAALIGFTIVWDYLLDYDRMNNILNIFRKNKK